MDTRESFISSENQEIRQQTPEESSKIGEKVSSVNERMSKNPFSTLDDKTIQAIIDTPNAHKIDVQTAKEEAKLREDEGRFDPESSDADIKQDLKDNYFTVNDGRFLAPTDEYVDYRKAIKKGEDRDIMSGVVRETVEERLFRQALDNYFDDKDHRKQAAKFNNLSEDRAIQERKKEIADINENMAIEKNNDKMANAAYESYVSCYRREMRKNRIPNESLDVEKLKTTFIHHSVASLMSILYRYPHSDYVSSLANNYIDIAEQSNGANVPFELLQDDDGAIEHKALEEAIRKNIESDTFCPEVLKNNPDSITQFLNEKQINPKNYSETAFDRVNYHAKYHADDPEMAKMALAYDKVFDIKNVLADSFIKYSWRRDTTSLIKIEDGALRPKCYEEISKPAIDIINQKASALAEQIQNSESYDQDVESAKSLAYQEIKNNIIDAYRYRQHEHYQQSDPNFDFLSSISQADASNFFNLNSYIPSDYSVEYKQLIRDKLPSISATIDVKPLLREIILERIKDGGVKVDEKLVRSPNYIGTEDFKHVMETLNVSFDDDDNYNAAFEGFIANLKTQNGEQSQTATDYYLDIFSDNPERFISTINAFREDNCPRGLKAKITRFLKNNEDYQAYVQQKKAMEELGLNNTELDDNAVLEATSYEEVQKLIDDRRNALIAALEAKSEDIDTTFKQETRGNQEKHPEDRNTQRNEKSLDFGIEKLSELNRWSLYLENNIDPDTRHFMRRFDNGTDKLKAYADPNTYHAITFEYGGKLCSIAESFSNDSSAMFVARAERDMAPEELVESMFESTKTDARERTDIGIERFYHYEDGLDSLYQKAFAYLKTGQRASNVQEAQENGNRLLGDMDEMGKISKNELPPQYPFI